MGDGLGIFPDAVTTRGQKHLQELMEMRELGHRAALVFCVQHTGIKRIKPADAIDPDYGRLLRAAADKGVELLAYSTRFDLAENSLELWREISVEL